MNLANKITLGRVLFVPVIIVLLHWPNKVFCLMATICLALACISDMLDGWVARREKQVTRFGKFLDPLADKLLVCSVLVMLTRLGWIPAWVTIVIIGRELIVTGLRAMAADQGVVIAADKYGKLKTILQSIALILLTLHYEWFGLSPVLPGKIVLLPDLYLQNQQKTDIIKKILYLDFKETAYELYRFFNFCRSGRACKKICVSEKNNKNMG